MRERKFKLKIISHNVSSGAFLLNWTILGSGGGSILIVQNQIFYLKLTYFFNKLWASFEYIVHFQ